MTAMASFNDAITVLMTKLQEDGTLQAFCQDKWKRKITVTKEFRQRVEIPLADLPVIVITRPSVRKEYRLSGGRENTNTVRLYCGFRQNDRKKSLEELIAFEELLDDILTANYRLRDTGNNPTVQNVHPTDSANDEGMNHPNYFMALEVEIEHRR